DVSSGAGGGRSAAIPSCGGASPAAGGSPKYIITVPCPPARKSVTYPSFKITSFGGLRSFLFAHNSRLYLDILGRGSKGLSPDLVVLGRDAGLRIVTMPRRSNSRCQRWLLS